MEKERIGTILATLRTEQNVSAEELCRGLCSKSAYSRYELGERVPDRLLVTRLISRLGRDTDKFASMSRLEEYWYQEWKHEAVGALLQGDWETLNRSLRPEVAFRYIINEVVQRQYHARMLVYKVRAFDKDYEKAMTICKEALEMSVPNVRPEELDKYLLSLEELRFMLELGRLYMAIGDYSEAEKWIAAVYEYASLRHKDKEARMKIIPDTVKIYLPLLMEQEKYAQAMEMCKESIKLQCWYGDFARVREVLEGYLECSRRLGSGEQAEIYEKWLWAINEFCDEYQISKCPQDNFLTGPGRQERYLVNEVFQFRRQELQLSQEEASEGICTPETLSRIESGKRTPSIKNFKALKGKLRLDIEYFNRSIDTTDFLLLEKKRELDRYLEIEEWDEAEEILVELEEAVDVSEPVNRQTILFLKSYIKYYQGRIAVSDFKQICEELLDCRNEEWRQPKYWSHFLTGTRISRLNSLAICYMEDRMEDALYILRQIYHAMQMQRKKHGKSYFSYELTIYNMTQCLLSLNQFEECARMIEEGLRRGKGRSIPRFLLTKSKLMRKQEKDIEAAKRYGQLAYWWSTMYSPKYAQTVAKYYRESFAEGVI